MSSASVARRKKFYNIDGRSWFDSKSEQVAGKVDRKKLLKILIFNATRDRKGKDITPSCLSVCGYAVGGNLDLTLIALRFIGLWPGPNDIKTLYVRNLRFFVIG
jgi:hypothetical protein